MTISGESGRDVAAAAQKIEAGRVMLLQTPGPVQTQRTDIVQRAQARLVWDKTMHQGLMQGAGLPLTIGHLPVVLPTGEGTRAEFGAWTDEIYSAAGVIVALLDDRIAQEEVFRDFVVFENDTWIGIADQRRNVRNFRPFVYTGVEDEQLERVVQDAIPENVMVAARWYLRGAQIGPAPDGIPLFWTALEAIVGAEGRQVVSQVEDAVRAVGEDPGELLPTLGRMFGVRADIVHRGVFDLDLIVKGWYVLEQVCRLLLRDRLGAQTTWPTAPDDSAGLPAPVRAAVGHPPETVWHEPKV